MGLIGSIRQYFSCLTARINQTTTCSLCAEKLGKGDIENHIKKTHPEVLVSESAKNRTGLSSKPHTPNIKQTGSVLVAVKLLHDTPNQN